MAVAPLWPLLIPRTHVCVSKRAHCCTPFSLSWTAENHCCGFGALWPDLCVCVCVLWGLSRSSAVLCTVLQDRIVFASFLKEKTFLWHRGVGILEPLILGVLGVRSFLLSIPTENHETVRWKTSEALSSILSRFECKRISPVLVDRLLGAELFDLALELVVKAPARLVWSVRYSVAVRALRFDVALGILEEQLVANRQNHGETIDSSSPLFQYFMDLGAACAEYGQFTLAAKCFDKVFLGRFSSSSCLGEPL